MGQGTGVRISEDKETKMVSEVFASASYWEPEGLVVSRTGNECVVALTDQWYLVYGEREWKAGVKAHLEKLQTYNPATLNGLKQGLEWLHEWACSRTYGLGTKLPWDEKWVIESLSDSTIYMAYYTVAHYLQSNLEGTVPGIGNIKPEQMTHEVWNYIFLRGPYPAASDKVPEESILSKMRAEFEYWYPVDVRASGKDLIANHLTMSLYNHAAIWEKDPAKWPVSFWTNGHLMVNGEKMSKSTGNFLTLSDACRQWSVDAVRATLADAGDTLDDANFVPETANKLILRLTKEETWIENWSSTLIKPTKEEYNFWDQVFDNEMNRLITDAFTAYSSMQYRNALKAVFFDFTTARDNYISSLSSTCPKHERLIRRWIEAFLVMLSPITPHLCQDLWRKIGRKGNVCQQPWPTAAPFDPILHRKIVYLRNARLSLIRQKAKATKGAKGIKIKICCMD